MQNLGCAIDSLARLRRERDRLGPAARACVDHYLDDAEPCLEALEQLQELADLDAFIGDVAESLAAFADEIASIVVDRHTAEDEDLLPDLVELARSEREHLADDARQLRSSPQLSARARLAVDALAVSLVATRRAVRRAA